MLKLFSVPLFKTIKFVFFFFPTFSNTASKEQNRFISISCFLLLFHPETKDGLDNCEEDFDNIDNNDDDYEEAEEVGEN